MLEAIIVSLITGLVLGGTVTLAVIGLMIGAHKGINDLEADSEGLQETMETWQPIGDRIMTWWRQRQDYKCDEEITKVTPEVSRYIIKNYMPLGLFYTQVDSYYIGIDNRNGDAWTEEFKSLKACKKWLREEMS